jgi:uncharacterized membrane protein YhaH (DUF805 family)
MNKSATQWMIEPIRKYASFSGRARRAEYWWFQLFYFLLNIGAAIIDTVFIGADAMGTYGIGPIGGLLALALIIPAIAVSFRRMHDLDRSAWWLLIGLIPLIGALVLLFWYVKRGTIGENRFGPDPLATSD